MKYPFRYRYDSDDDVELDNSEEASGWDTPWPLNLEREDEQEDEKEDEEDQEGPADHVSTTPDTPPTVSKGDNAPPPQPQSPGQLEPACNLSDSRPKRRRTLAYIY